MNGAKITTEDRDHLVGCVRSLLLALENGGYPADAWTLQLTCHLEDS